jgi:hypothetical protein
MQAKVLLAGATAAVLTAACGEAPTPSRGGGPQGPPPRSSPTSTAPAAIGPAPSDPASSPRATGATAANAASPAGGPSGARQSSGPPHHPAQPPPTATPSSSGSCPDPRYCADYITSGGAWPSDGAGHVVIHYRVNPSHDGGDTTLTATLVIAAVEHQAQVLMAADPAVELVDDGTTSDQAAGFNNVVGFVPATGFYVNMPLRQAGDGHTYNGFNIQLALNAPWRWAPCDGDSTPCDPYPGTGVDVGAMLTHAWGHVLGLSDLGGDADRLLSNYGGISAGPDCSTYGPVCRFASTLGLGDVLGVRHLYHTSAPMPRLVYDQ